MADAECEQQANENDFDIMHVDSVPAASDREDLSISATNNLKDILPDASLFDKVDETKLAQRANRFGTDVSIKKMVVDESDLNLLYHSFEIDNHEAAETKHKIRLNAIHLRGVESMNTQDVLDYFKDYSPVLVEWINDQSCNVVWSESISSARAMLDLSRPIQRSVTNKTPVSKEFGDEIASEPEEGEDVEMTEQENDPRNRHTSDVGAQHSHFRRNSGDQSSTPVPNNSPVDSSQIDDVTSSIGTAVDSSKIEIPVPPGHWRIGNSTDKAKALLLRFAYRSDRKHPGAEKLSQYYVKHGNPNYKGLKGIISSSYKSKVLDGRKRPHYVDLDAPTGDNLYKTIPSDSEDDLINTGIQQEQAKRPRMRMYADEEEEKQKKSSTSACSALHPADLRNRIVHEKLPTVGHPTSLDDLRTRLYSRQPWNTPQEDESFDQELADVQSLLTPKNLSMPIVVGDLRNKLEKLRQARQPKVPLLIEVTQDDA